MTLRPGRVQKNASAVPAPAPVPGLGRRLSRAGYEARTEAARIVGEAEQQARRLVSDAERHAADARLRAEEAGRALGLAHVAAWSIRLRDAEASADARSLDRVVELAHVLAEQLIGRALALDPGLVSELAREALAHAGGARRVRVLAHADDAPVLRRSTASFDPDGRVVEVLPDPSLRRGDLRLETDLGVLDARLGSELDRLAVRLREALRK